MTTSRRLTVLLVDQDRRVRAALVKLLSATEPGWNISAVAVVPAPLTLTTLPAVAVVDVPMVTSTNVLALIGELRAAAVAVVAISAYDALRGQALASGARAFLSKDSNTDLIVQAVRAAADDMWLASAPRQLHAIISTPSRRNSHSVTDPEDLAMSGNPPTQRPDPFVRFRHGDIECTVVSDGILQMGPARVNFPTADPQQVDALLTEHYLPTENVQLNENILIANIGGRLVQFDSGVGVDPEFGRGFFGAGTGQVIPNMRAAGIDPADIDIVAITHTHPDHVWGLVDADGVPLYPNATVAVSREDFDYWTDLSHVADAPNQHMKDHFLGAHKNLLPYAEASRITWVADGTEIADGITAISTPGHSPGHVIYRMDSDNESLIIWGDLCHHQVLLLQRPEWAFQFDYEKAAATAQRWRVYEMVDTARSSVLAYHFPFPGLGHLKKDGNAYAWLPAELERRSTTAEDSTVSDTAVTAGAR